MLALTEFKGDNNKQIKNAQHHQYRFLVGYIAGITQEAFLKCDSVCNKLTKEERTNLANTIRYDHRTLQRAHDMIAAVFRYQNQSGMLSLFEQTSEGIIDQMKSKHQNWEQGKLSDHELIYCSHWDDFFMATLREFTNPFGGYPETAAEFIKHAVSASSFNPNTNEGYDSEVALTKLIVNFFKMETVIIDHSMKIYSQRALNNDIEPYMAIKML